MRRIQASAPRDRKQYLRFWWMIQTAKVLELPVLLYWSCNGNFIRLLSSEQVAFTRAIACTLRREKSNEISDTETLPLSHLIASRRMSDSYPFVSSLTISSWFPWNDPTSMFYYARKQPSWVHPEFHLSFLFPISLLCRCRMAEMDDAPVLIIR
jgi:hypothetical protein